MNPRPLVAAVALCLACGSPAVPVGMTPDAATRSRFPWLEELTPPNPPVVPLRKRFPTPPGTRRTEVSPNGFGAWLRELPVRTDRSTVHTWDGRMIDAPSAAVVALDVGDRDLQQCADTILRLHAEWLWSTGQTDRATYRFTSGDPMSWNGWVAGERFRVSGSRVVRGRGLARHDTRESYRAWLELVFTYAGTLSMPLDTEAVADGAVLEPGDVFVAPGSPGHAVVVLDVARDRAGRSWGLIGQGFTPAQELHVVASRDSARDDVWFALPSGESESLATPSWEPFPRRAARRFTTR